MYANEALKDYPHLIMTSLCMPCFSVLKEAMVEAGNLTPKDIDAIAYTKGFVSRYKLIHWQIRC